MPIGRVLAIASVSTALTALTGCFNAEFTWTSAAGSLALTSVTPSLGLESGGDTLVLKGTGFEDGDTVYVGTATCATLVTLSATELDCVTAASSAQGAVDVTVADSSGNYVSLPAAFDFEPFLVTYPTPKPVLTVGSPFAEAPALSGTAGATYAVSPALPAGLSLNPASGAVSGSPSFVTGASDYTVTATDASLNQVSVTLTIQVNDVPPSALAYAQNPVSAAMTGVLIATDMPSNGGGAITSYSVNPALPAGLSLNPLTGYVSGTPTAPQTAASYTITGANSGGSTPVSLTISIVDPVPTVTGIAPGGGPLAGGTPVTITGTDFMSGAIVTASSVNIGGNPCTGLTVVNSSTITCTTSAGSAGVFTVNVVVTDGQTGSLANAFGYNPPPGVSSVTPPFGKLSGGQSISIAGAGFQSGATVSIGGIACPSSNFINPSAMTCTTPVGVSIDVPYDVVVTNPDNQNSAHVAGDWFTYITPTVTGVNPSSGPITGGQILDIQGTDFMVGATPTVASVNLGGYSCGGVGVVSATDLHCTTIAAGPGTVPVNVLTADGQAGSLSAAYTYNGAPSIASVNTPLMNGTIALGSANGGTTVVIGGSGFISPTVKLGTSACSVTGSSPTSITCTSGAASSGLVTVTVTNVDLQQATRANGYDYVSVSQLAVGDDHSCAVLSDGNLVCWGDNAYGQSSGDGSTSNYVAPTLIPGLSNIAQVAVAGDMAGDSGSTCALDLSGNVHCWGLNSSGQLGLGTTLNETTPQTLGGITGVAEISMGLKHTCAVTSAGHLYCWGYDGNGACCAPTQSVTTYYTTPQQIDTGLPGTLAAAPNQIATGVYHTCAIVNANIYCWGGGGDYQLGNNEGGDVTTGYATTYDYVAHGTGGAETLSALSGNSDDTCAVVDPDNLVCWGPNSSGELGDTTTNPAAIAETVDVNFTYSELATTGDHTCGIYSGTSELYCWGAGGSYALGTGTTANEWSELDAVYTTGTAVNFPSGGAVTQVGAGSGYTCAVAGGDAFCWGTPSNVSTYYQLGFATLQITEPMAPRVAPP